MERLNQNSSPDQVQDAAQSVFSYLSDYLFDRINFISFPFTQARQVSGNDLVPVTDTTQFWGTSRLTDTAEGKFLRPDRSSRMRCDFYLENPNDLEGYLLSPVVYDSFTSLTTIDSVDIFRAYIGLKFSEGTVTIVTKEANGVEVEHSTSLSFNSSGATDTFVFEIKHFITYADVYIDNELVGSYETDMVGNFDTTKTLLPLFSPAKSLTGDEVNIVIENYQFIQDR